jgi:hypothetical protein
VHENGAAPSIAVDTAAATSGPRVHAQRPSVRANVHSKVVGVAAAAVHRIGAGTAALASSPTCNRHRISDRPPAW